MGTIKNLGAKAFKGFVHTATRSSIIYGERIEHLNKGYLGEGVSTKKTGHGKGRGPGCLMRLNITL